ncbi:Bgt-20211 [Blumeria graminis f. sp. tritici]|uniref:Bgt-20211 n=2 Tax=Blumeria graminis f. sp. tritici TaxID=62690 RepID=A0A381L5N0_BLUGR|nr:Bgt-20211 [Blumeria graminis f. sp. tritici]
MSLEKPASDTKVRKHLTRDQCIEVRTLRRHGLTLQKIANELGFTIRDPHQN